MHRVRMAALFMLIGIAVTTLAACGGAPATRSGTPTAAAATATAPAPTRAAEPTAAPAPTAQVSGFTDHPNDATQARLRLAHFDLAGPNVDLFVNGAKAVNAGQAQINIPSGYVNNYLFLAPATYHVAVVSTGKPLDQALIGPLDVPLVAGHRYTLVILRQLKDNTFKPLVIDETAAEQQLGAKPTDIVRIMVNNVAGVDGIDIEADGKRISTNIPYGGFAAGIYPAEQARISVLEHGKATRLWEGVRGGDPGSRLVAIAGRYTPGASDTLALVDSLVTSELNLIDFLHSFSGRNITNENNPGVVVTFETFLAAIKAAGLTEQLATGGPYYVLPPTDGTFANLPKARLDALMANPKALANLVRNHVVAEYVPRGSLQKTPGGTPLVRSFTNLMGAKMTISLSTEGDLLVNGVEPGGIGSTFIANGTQVHPLYEVLLPDAT